MSVGSGIVTSGSSRSRINRAFNRFLLHKPKSMVSVDAIDADPAGSGLYPNNSLSNPDLLHNSAGRDSSVIDEKTLAGGAASGIALSSASGPASTSEYPEHVLKVYKSDQTFKYLLVHKETTAHEVVMLSLQEFGITETSSNFRSGPNSFCLFFL